MSDLPPCAWPRCPKAGAILVNRKPYCAGHYRLAESIVTTTGRR